MKTNDLLCRLALLLLLLPTAATTAQTKVPTRARDLGIPFEGQTGKLNAITDVKGVEVGFCTLIEGEGKLVAGKGPVRTGVTAVLPRGKNLGEAVFAGWFSLNGNGEMTGTTWVEESGQLDGPVMITNTHSVGAVHEGVIRWRRDQKKLWGWSLPLVAETWDGWLNDVNGFHVRPKHVKAAIEGARGGAVMEGNVGGGTGMICYGFKGGTGTASRVVSKRAGGYTVGVLVQANFGNKYQLQVAGAPVGAVWNKKEYAAALAGDSKPESGSIIIVIATDAPLLPHQCKRLARRAGLGVARTGGTAGNGSGDIFVAFATGNDGLDSGRSGTVSLKMITNSKMNPLLRATALATEEAIINALVAARTMTGRDDHTIEAIDHKRLQKILKAHKRL